MAIPVINWKKEKPIICNPDYCRIAAGADLCTYSDGQIIQTLYLIR